MVSTQVHTQPSETAVFNLHVYLSLSHVVTLQKKTCAGMTTASYAVYQSWTAAVLKINVMLVTDGGWWA